MMYQIEVDFEVMQTLWAKRKNEESTNNDALREVLGLPAKKVAAGHLEEHDDRSFVCDGVEFPPGTEFRMKYRGEWHFGRVSDGGLVVNGKRYGSVSAPSVDLTKTARNGWKDWECKLPGGVDWQSIDSIRSRGRNGSSV
jgi:hypothetical protein